MAKRNQSTRPTPRGAGSLSTAPRLRGGTAGEAIAAEIETPLPVRLSFAALCLLLIIAPYYLSGFWPASLEIMAGEAYLPLAMFLSLTACACLLMGLSGRARYASERVRNFLPWLVAGLFAWSCLAAMTTVHLHDTLLELARVGGCVVWFFVTRSLLNNTDPETAATRRLWVLSAITTGAVLVAGPAVFSYFQTRQPQFGTFYNPNLFANYCAMTIPIALGWAVLATRAAKVHRPEFSPLPILLPALVPAFIIALGLLSSSSKGGLLSLLVALLVFAVAAWRARSAQIVALVRANAVIVGIVAVLLLMGAGVVFSKTVLPRLVEARALSDHSTVFRTYIWRSTVDMAQARPLLGWGPGSFPAVFGQFAIAGYTRSAHQLWLQLAAETGVPAMLLMAGACLLALGRYWKALRTPDWAIGAAGLSALAAFTVHGMTDAGWSMTSIAALLMVLLALADSPGATPATSPVVSDENQRESALNLPWLGVTIVCALAAAGVQRAVRAEDLRAESEVLLRERGAPRQALEKAREATEVDPLSSRAWINLGIMQAGNREDARAAFNRAIALQPTRPFSYVTVANYLDEAPQSNPKEVEQFFNRAVALDPNNSTIRLSRAKWLLERNDARGWDDLEYIAKLAGEPYGKYPATPQFVNLDFAQAYIRLVPRLRLRGDKASLERANAMIRRGLEDVRRARGYEAETSAYEEFVPNAVGAKEELNEVEARLNELARQAGIKTTESE